MKLFREKKEQFFRNFVCFAFTILIAGFILNFLAPDLAALNDERFRGVFGGPNGLGMYCLLAFIVFFLIKDLYPDLFRKWEWNILFASVLISIYLCGSRNALIAILIFYLFQRFFSFSPFLGFVLFVIALFGVEIASSYTTSIILSLGLGDYFRIQTLEEGSGRYIAWNFAWKQIQHNFFLGKGFAYNEAYMRHHYGFLLKLNHQGGIHNSFLTFWMDQGLIGLLIYLRCYILTFIKASKITKYAFPIMFAVSFSAFFESWLVGSLSAFAFLGMFIFTFITSEEIYKTSVKETSKETDEDSLPLINPIPN